MTDAEPTWDGRDDCECGEHVTTNDRTWCLEDKEWCYPDALCRGCELPVLRAEVERLRGAIQTVLDDDETGAGGWGPDVTMAEVLRVALEAKPMMQSRFPKRAGEDTVEMEGKG